MKIHYDIILYPRTPGTQLYALDVALIHTVTDWHISLKKVPEALKPYVLDIMGPRNAEITP